MAFCRFTSILSTLEGVDLRAEEEVLGQEGETLLQVEEAAAVLPSALQPLLQSGLLQEQLHCQLPPSAVEIKDEGEEEYKKQVHELLWKLRHGEVEEDLPPMIGKSNEGGDDDDNNTDNANNFQVAPV